MTTVSPAKRIEFERIEVRIGDFGVDWIYLGEGLGGGDYRPHEPGDTPCLRFVCKKYFGRDNPNVSAPIKDGSYLTELPVTTPKDNLLVASRRLLEIIAECDAIGENLAARLELMSHLSLANFELHPPFLKWTSEALR